MVDTIKRFFELGTEEKARFRKLKNEHVGWADIGRESFNPERVGDYKESFNFQPYMMNEGEPVS